MEDGFMEVEFVNPDTQFLQLNEFSLSGDDDYMFELLPDSEPKAEQAEPKKPEVKSAEAKDTIPTPEPKPDPAPKASSRASMSQAPQTAAREKSVVSEPKASPKNRTREKAPQKVETPANPKDALRLSSRMAHNASILLESARDGTPFLRERALIQLQEHGYFDYAEIRDKIQEFAQQAKDREWKRYYREWLEKT